MFFAAPQCAVVQCSIEQGLNLFHKALFNGEKKNNYVLVFSARVALARGYLGWEMQQHQSKPYWCMKPGRKRWTWMGERVKMDDAVQFLGGRLICVMCEEMNVGRNLILLLLNSVHSDNNKVGWVQHCDLRMQFFFYNRRRKKWGFNSLLVNRGLEKQHPSCFIFVAEMAVNKAE